MPKHCRATHDLRAYMDQQDRTDADRAEWQHCFQCEEETAPDELVEFLTLPDGVQSVCAGCIRTAMSGDHRNWKAFLVRMTTDILNIHRNNASAAAMPRLK